MGSRCTKLKEEMCPATDVIESSVIHSHVLPVSRQLQWPKLLYFPKVLSQTIPNCFNAHILHR